MRPLFSKLFLLLSLAGLPQLSAQVTTATLYGVVRDASGAVVPSANVTVSNQDTGLMRTTQSDPGGEFALPALPTGRYTLQIEASGFKTYTNQAIQLGAGQTLRQTYALEVGQISDKVTVTESSQIVETATAAQQESLGRQEANELPLSRRNLVNLVVLAPGTSEASVGIAGGGNIRLNGVAEGGNAITVDGTDAVANPETRGLSQYGGQSQISIMSVDAVAEVQIVKGILPAEYGGVVGGQVNFITRSGANQFHGSAIENYQNEAFFARDTFLPAASAKPKNRFNQFGGSLGGPIKRNRAFFFTTYEGYRETAGIVVTGTVPTQALKDQILGALQFPETKLVLDTLPLPNQPVNANVGQYTAARQQTRSENHALAKGDVLIFGGNLSVTFSRMRPDTVVPQIYVNGANDQHYLNQQDRVAAQFVRSSGAWISETRYGWNRTGLLRVQNFWYQIDPAHPTEPELTTVGRRVPQFSVAGLFSTPGVQSLLDLRGRSFSAEQKVSHIVGKHVTKMGINWARNAGSRTNPEAPNLTFQTIPDMLANIPSTMLLQSGQPPHDGHLDQYGAFIQDDWRVNQRLVLNLGMRYDFAPTVQFQATTDRPAQIYNLEPPTDINKLDFGAVRPPDHPYDAYKKSFGPRAGFAWTLDDKGRTVIRGGSGVLFSAPLFATLQNTVTDLYLPSIVTFNRTDLSARNIRWPAYGEDVQRIIRQDGGGKPIVYSIVDTHLKNPYTVQTSIDVERQLWGAWMAEVGYFRTDGGNFPMHRPFGQAFDRVTGARPNPILGTSSGYYVTSEQTMVYNALQASVRHRFTNNFGFDFHYTLNKGWSDQGGALASNFVNGDIFVTQDFFNPFIDREPLSQEARHRASANLIYQLPSLKKNGWMGQVLKGWQISSIVTGRSGFAMRVTQPSGIPNSRPDFLGGDPSLSNYRDTRLYLNKASFGLVPTAPATAATIRAGTQNPSQVHGPGSWTLNASLAKTFTFTDAMRLELRGDWLNAFNHVNYDLPQASIVSPIFGVITSDAGPRTGQISARFTF